MLPKTNNNNQGEGRPRGVRDGRRPYRRARAGDYRALATCVSIIVLASSALALGAPHLWPSLFLP